MCVCVWFQEIVPSGQKLWGADWFAYVRACARARSAEGFVCVYACIHFPFGGGSPRTRRSLTQLMMAAMLRFVSRARVFPAAAGAVRG